MKIKKNFRIDEIMIVLIVALLAFAVSLYESDKKVATLDAEKITCLILDDHDISFAGGGIIDRDKLQLVQNMDYQELKDQLNVRQDFCMYIEDENGNIILAKGSPKLGQEGIVCSK